MIQRLVDAWHVLRPRAIVQINHDVDALRTDVRRLREELGDIRLALKDLREQGARMEARQEQGFSTARTELDTAVTQLKTNVARLEVKESQLRAISRRDLELENKEASLASVMCSAEVEAHVNGQIAGATLQDYPFPYAVVDRLLPDSLYDALITGLPPVELFHDRQPNKRHLTVPLKLAPSYTRRIWDYMARTVAARMVTPAVIDKFRPALTEWLRDCFPTIGEDRLGQLRMHASDGRILLRTNGYVIPPHRDPKWGFLTCVLYLARAGDSESWGTQLYAVEEDEEARNTMPNWIEVGRCREVCDVTFLPNRALVFVNSVGAHGARIPEDAQPESLERYIYQFRIGPRSDDTRWMIETLPAERRALWAGGPTDY